MTGTAQGALPRRRHAVPSRRERARRLTGGPGLRVVAVTAAVLLLGWWGSPYVTHWEAAATAYLAHFTGLDMTEQLPGTNLVRGYHGYQPFFIRITPSCSALTTSAAAVGVSVFILGGTWRRRITGAVLAVVLLSVGNLARLVAVLWVGRGAGIHPMITFHDWGGTVFSYVLLLVALLLLIAVRLPRRARRDRRQLRKKKDGKDTPDD